MAQLKAAVQIDIGNWHRAAIAGNDPVALTIDTLHGALNHAPGIAETYWRAGVLDIGGARYLSYDPAEIPPFATMFIECLLVLTTEGES